jgi:hypothetical protein
MDSEDLAKLTKTELQARLRDKGLPVSGTKAQAIGKLRKEARSQSTLSRFAGFAGFVTSSPGKLVNWIHTARASARGVSGDDSDATKDAGGGTYYDLTDGPTGAAGAPNAELPPVGPTEGSEEEPAEAEQHREAGDAPDGGAGEEDGERHGQDEGLAPAEGASSQQ